MKQTQQKESLAAESLPPPPPLFLTQKYRIEQLSTRCNVYDFQLRDHLLLTEDLYRARCKCYHTHNKKRCRIIERAYCHKCNLSCERYVDHKALLYHRNVDRYSLAVCCSHRHEPPCRICLSCRVVYPRKRTAAPAAGTVVTTISDSLRLEEKNESREADKYTAQISTDISEKQESEEVKVTDDEDDYGYTSVGEPPLTAASCSVQLGFECHYTTQAVCDSKYHEKTTTTAAAAVKTDNDQGGARFTNTLEDADMLHEHVYNLRDPLFFLCEYHQHRHRMDGVERSMTREQRDLVRRVPCFVQMTKCCEHAVHVTEYPSSFILSVTRKNPINATSTATATTTKTRKISNSRMTTTKRKRSIETSDEDDNDDEDEDHDDDEEEEDNNEDNGEKQSGEEDDSSISNSNNKRFKQNRINNKKKLLTASRTTTEKMKRRRSNHSEKSNRSKQLALEMRNCFNEYVIYDPSLWRDQSRNHFVSLCRAVVHMPELVPERFQRFETSNFVVPSIKKFKSGKQSAVRTMITGFETRGIYQTATMSCVLPYTIVLIPQRLYAIMKQSYDLTYVAVKRDPSIKQTCMFVCRALRNPDPLIDVIIIPDGIAKPLNQDQDGDKNGIYVLPLFVRGYDRRASFLHRIAKFEMSRAFGNPLTLVATPRYSFSENNYLVMHRNCDSLMSESNFFRRYYPKGIHYMLEVGSGYMHDEFREFCNLLIHYNRTRNNFIVTIKDLAIMTDTLSSIVSSGAKGSHETLMMFINNIREHHTIDERRKEMIDQMNRYIVSSQELSHTGRKQFISQFAAHDLVVLDNRLYLNKVLIADCNRFASVGTFMFNEPSLSAFIEDLEALPAASS